MHIWHYDRAGAIQSSGLDITYHLPHFLVLLLALQRLDQTGWGFPPELKFNPHNDHCVELPVTRHLPDGDVPAVARFGQDAIRMYWGLVGRATTVYECQILDTDGGVVVHDAVIKLSWPEATRAKESDTAQKLANIDDPTVRGHIPVLLASRVDDETSTQKIRDRLSSKPHNPNQPSRGPRVLVITVWKRLYPVWDLSADEWRTVLTHCALCTFV
jgi:Fungal protein kinase